MLIRGFYYEGWDPSQKPERVRSKEAFLAHVAEILPNDPELDPERVTRAVFELLTKRIPRGEIQHVRSSLPKEIKELWPKLDG